MSLIVLGVLVTVMVAAGFAPAAALRATPVPPSAAAFGTAARPLVGDPQDVFRAYVAKQLDEFAVLGASVAVVQDGDIVFLEGFGETEQGGDPVDPDTRMMLGSVTKSVTGLLAASLVDDGRLSWDTPLVDLLPGFAAGDPTLTDRLTVADAFCMCTGIPRRDAEIILRSDQLSPQNLIRSMSGLRPTAPFGERYQYSNQLFAVGGYAAAAAAGAAGDDLFAGYRLAVQERVLGPIGMDRSTFALDSVVAEGNFAVGHGVDLDGNAEPVPLMQEDRFVNAVAPAGALWSSARDMARYAQALLDGGVAADGASVVSPGQVERLWAPRIAIPADPANPTGPFTGDSAYALGWYVGDYAGRRIVAHTGGTFGFSSLVTLVPEADLGLVVLTNGITGAFAAPLIAHRLLELTFDRPAAGERLMAPSIEATVAQFNEIADGLAAVDPVVLTPFLGRYVNPVLGEARVTLRDGVARFDTGAVASALRPLAAAPGEPVPYLFAEPPLNILPGALVFVPGNDGRPTLILSMTDRTGGEPVTYVYERVDESGT